MEALTGTPAKLIRVLPSITAGLLGWVASLVTGRKNLTEELKVFVLFSSFCAHAQP